MHRGLPPQIAGLGDPHRPIQHSDMPECGGWHRWTGEVRAAALPLMRSDLLVELDVPAGGDRRLRCPGRRRPKLHLELAIGQGETLEGLIVLEVVGGEARDEDVLHRDLEELRVPALAGPAEAGQRGGLDLRPAGAGEEQRR